MDCLPNEVMLMVFEYLPRKSLLGISQISKAWYQIAMICLRRNVYLYGYNSIRKLEECLLNESNSTLGQVIKQLTFIKRYRAGKAITKTTFFNLIKLCPNLEILDFRDVPSHMYLEWLAESQDLGLNNLKDIQIQETPESCTDVVYRFRNTLECITLTRKCLSILNQKQAKDLYSRLSDLPRLKNLTLRYGSHFLVLDTLLQTVLCLSTLDLRTCRKLIPFKDADININSSIECLMIDMYTLSEELCRYIYGYLVGLRTLYFSEGCRPSFNRLLAFNVLVRRVNTQTMDMFITLSNLKGTEPQVLKILSPWLSHMKRLEFEDCTLQGYRIAQENYMINLHYEKLERVSIDIAHLLGIDSKVDSVCLEITINDKEDTMMTYFRKGKKRNKAVFERKTSDVFTNSKARQKRWNNQQCAVLQINVYMLKSLYLYCMNHTFNQTIEIE